MGFLPSEEYVDPVTSYGVDAEQQNDPRGADRSAAVLVSKSLACTIHNRMWGLDSKTPAAHDC